MTVKLATAASWTTTASGQVTPQPTVVRFSEVAACGEFRQVVFVFSHDGAGQSLCSIVVMAVGVRLETTRINIISNPPIAQLDVVFCQQIRTIKLWAQVQRGLPIDDDDDDDGGGASCGSVSSSDGGLGVHCI